MLLTFTGIGSAYHPEMGSNSAYFVADQSLYILDCGESVFKRMKAMNFDFASFERVVFFITHMHSDHIGSLAGFVSYLSHVVEIRPYVVHPLQTLADFFTLCGIYPDEYVQIMANHYDDEHVQVAFEPTEHVANMQCFGLYINIPVSEQSFYYSGDAAILPKKYLDAFNAGEIDIWYQDVTIHADNASHYYYKNLFAEVKADRLGHVICMHLEEQADEVLKEAGLRCASLPKV
ncbi:MBL fold metallo-hydrolase [Allofustis seminis]|uniref:MBL fold metallo-hydrolase n=1 Tax=Allofustis seminis TaxID=166939 RepID=UPI00035E8FB5|nr:MBL fold metallo-hydrolase [Allofustis seminis]